MSSNLIIRMGREEDKPALAKLNLEFMREVMDSHPYWAKLGQPSPEELERVFARALAAPEKIRIVVAEREGEIAGYANTWEVFSIWSGGMILILDDLYVSASHRGAGIGERILRHVIETARERGFKRVQLSAEPENHVAHGLYGKLQIQDKQMCFFMKPR